MSKVKCITIINQYIGSPYHGMEYRHYYMAKNLKSLGYDVTLVSGSYSHLFSTQPKVEGAFTKESIDGINYIWVKVPKYSSSKSIGRIWNMIYFGFKLYFLKDLPLSHVIVSSPSLFPVKFGRKLADKFRTKFLFEVRDIWPLTLVELSNISDTNMLIRFMSNYEKFAYKNADKIISLLPTAKEYFVSKGMSNKNFVYLPNGIEFDNTSELPSDLASQIPKDKFIVAYTGTIGIANNLDYLLDVANELKDIDDIHFIILGQGGQKNRLQERATKLKLNNITFINTIKKEMVNAFLKEIDVAFISLLPEKLFRFGVSPNKVFEYMYAKKPIIWAIEAGNNLVKDADCGLSVPLKDINKLKESILELKLLPTEKLKQLGQNGYNFANTQHSYKILAKKLADTVEE